VRTVAALLMPVVLFGQTKPATRAGATAGKEASDDRRIEQAIRARFAESKIASDRFEVRVQGGVATIEGRTDVIQHKGTATRLAKSMGAVRVVNKIEISQAAREKASASLAKGRRRAQLKRGDKRSARDEGK
jgi:hypothetical protein